MFVIVRHGNTFENGETPRRVGARTDLPLTAKGWEQARALGAYFANKDIQFDRILISPLLRTQQTARAILDAQPSPPEAQTAEFLREIDYGPDENKPESEVLARIGSAALEAWEKRGEEPEGWIVNASERLEAWRDLLTDAHARPGSTLLVTSNGAARFALLAEPELAKASAQLESLKLPTGGFGIVARSKSGRLDLIEWGERP
ncbi:MAG: histidine phosphatase family protein [Pseudomonadota bacterium]